MPDIPPMLATRLEDPRRLADPRYSVEPKLDAQRASSVSCPRWEDRGVLPQLGLDLLRLPVGSGR